MPIDRLYKTSITIPAAQIGSGGVSGFSAKLTTPCFANCQELVTLGSPFALQAGAGDVLIYDSTGTLRYAVDVIRCDLNATWTNSVVEINFGQLSLSSVVDGSFWLYSGHALPQSQPAANAPYGQYAVYETAAVGYWPLSDGSGLTASERTSNQNNGTLVNGPTWSTGKIGNAVYFDGGDDKVILSLPALSAVTFSVWAYLYSVGPYQTLIGTNTNNVEPWLFVQNGHLLYWKGSYPVSVLTVPAGAWVHLCLSEGPNSLTFGVNGILETRATTGGSWPSGTYAMGNHGSNQDQLSGLLDDGRIYNRTLSAADITTSYNSTNSPASFCVLGARQSNVTGSPAAYRRRSASRYGISL